MNEYSFLGNGRNKDFYFTFPFFTKSDIIVKINGTETTGYGIFCIPGNGNNNFPFTGGHIHFAPAPKSTDIVTIERDLQYNRLIDYQETLPLNPKIVNLDMNYFFELLKDIKGKLKGFSDTYSEFTDTPSAQNLLERINAVMTEIENLGDITTIRTNISELGTSITNLTNSLNSLTTAVGTNTTNIGLLNTFQDGILDYVVETQSPTANNNYTWYRKYKSGWVEQGGKQTGTSTGSVTITLPTEMADTNYNIQASSSDKSLFASAWIASTTQITVETRGHDYSQQPCRCFWQVSGIAAN